MSNSLEWFILHIDFYIILSWYHSIDLYVLFSPILSSPSPLSHLWLLFLNSDYINLIKVSWKRKMKFIRRVQRYFIELKGRQGLDQYTKAKRILTRFCICNIVLFLCRMDSLLCWSKCDRLKMPTHSIQVSLVYSLITWKKTNSFLSASSEKPFSGLFAVLPSISLQTVQILFLLCIKLYVFIGIMS